MAQSKYLRRVNAIDRNTGQSDTERGFQAGESVGKLFSGLTTAIKGAQKDALANKLMNTMDAPRAALVSAPDTGGPQPAATNGQTQDLGQLPDDSTSSSGDTTFTNPATGNIEPLQNSSSDADLSKAMAESSLGGGPNIGDAATAASTATTLPPVTVTGNASNALPPGVSTAGTAPHRGGVAELEMMKEGLALQAQKSSIADRLAEAAGTGRYAKRAQAVPKGGYRMSTGGNNPWDNAGDDGTATDTSTDGSSTAAAGSKSKKPPPYEAGTFDAENDAPNDNYHKIQTDFDGRFGKGAYSKVAPLMSTAKIQSDGSVIIPDPKDDTKTLMTIGKDDAKYYMDRMNNVGNRQGMSHIGPLGEGANRYSNAEPGTETNPVVIHNNREFFALPYGTVAKDIRTGAVVRRLAPGAPGATHG